MKKREKRRPVMVRLGDEVYKVLEKLAKKSGGTILRWLESV